KLSRLLVATHEHDWNSDPFSRGAYSYQAVGGSSAPARLAEPVAGTLFFAGEATERDENGTVPGAIASGRREARRLLRCPPLAFPGTLSRDFRRSFDWSTRIFRIVPRFVSVSLKPFSKWAARSSWR